MHKCMSVGGMTAKGQESLQRHIRYVLISCCNALKCSGLHAYYNVNFDKFILVIFLKNRHTCPIKGWEIFSRVNVTGIDP